MASRGRRGSPAPFSSINFQRNAFNEYRGHSSSSSHIPPLHFAPPESRQRQGNQTRRRNHPKPRLQDSCERLELSRNVSKSTLTCPKCRRFYDLKSKCPLIMPCDHTICEDCLMAKITPKGISITCTDCYIDCNLMIPIKTDFNIRNHFPINYYLAGKIYFNRVHDQNELLASGKFVSDDSLITSTPDDCVSLASVSADLEKCSSCSELALIRCLDCNCIFCKLCSEKSHNAPLKEAHRMWPLVITRCEAHNGNPQEFYCFQCNENYCSYCIIDNHTNHNFKQFTKLQENDLKEFTTLLENCTQILRKLEMTNEVVSRRLKLMQPTRQLYPEFDKKATKFFQGIHAKLQLFERKLMQQAKVASNSSQESLKQIQEQLSGNILAVKNLISIGEEILNKKNFNAWQNIDVIMLKMYSAKQLPVKLLVNESVDSDNEVDFDFDDFTDNLFKNIRFNVPMKYKYRLIADDDCNSHSDSSSSISEVTIGSDMRKSVFIQCGDQVEIKRKTPVSKKVELFEPEVVNVSTCPVDAVSFREFVRKEVQKGAMDNVRIMHFINPRQFYVQILRQQKMFTNFHKQLSNMMNSLSIDIDVIPTLNQTYLVEHPKDPHWRRGIVYAIDANARTCMLSLIDFGVKFIAPFKALRPVTEILCEIIPFALECGLPGIAEPKDKPWTEDVATDIVAMMDSCNISMTILNVLPGNKFEVDLKVYSTQQNYFLKEALLFTGRAISASCEPQEDEMDILPSSSSVTYKSEMFNQNAVIMVKLLSVVNANTIFVQNLAVIEFYTQLSLALNEHYNKFDVEQRVYVPKVGMAVAVRENRGNITWNRGLILDIKQGQGSVQVLLVDVGKELTVSYENIRKLEDKFLALNSMAVKVKLAHVTYTNKEQNEIGKVYLANWLEITLKMVIHIAGVEPEVTLFDPRNGFADICINAQLVKAGLISTGFFSMAVDWPKQEEEREPKQRELFTKSLMRQAQGGSNDSDSEESMEEISTIQLELVRILNVVNPDCIYVHLCDNKKFMAQLHKISLDLQTHYTANTLKTHETWNVDDIAVAFDKKTKLYFRVIIIARLAGISYEVFGQDYGNTFTATSDCIGEMDSLFHHVPALAWRVRLYGVKPLGTWSLMASDYIKDLVMDKPNTYITKLKDTEGDSMNAPVLMWLKEVGPMSALTKTKIKTFCINKLLCKNGLAILDKNFTLPKPGIAGLNQETDNSSGPKTEMTSIENPSSKSRWLPSLPVTAECLQGIATFVDDDGVVYFHEISDRNELQKYEESLTKRFVNFKPDASLVWKAGDICSVKYHQNNKWYRGEVLGVSGDNKELRVCMIDYGNVEDVNYDEISPEVMYLSCPRLAKKLRLHNVQTKKGFTVKILDMFHSLIVDKVIDIKCIPNEDTTQPPFAIVNIGRDLLNTLLQDEIKFVEINEEAANEASNGGRAHSDDVEFEGNINLITTNNMHGFNYMNLPDGNIFEVLIVNVLELNKVVFELAASPVNTLEFHRLQDSINRKWQEQPILANFKVGQPCIARYYADDIWYRAKVVAYGESPLVHFVDFGNVEAVTLSDMREIQTDWLALPVEQFVAILSDFKFSIDNHDLVVSAVSHHLSQYIDTKKLVKIIKRHPLSIQLYNTSNAKLSYQELIDTGVLRK